jgi:glucosamine--fructose-6-phosphate aminotransferase (isomerizing)
MCGIVGYIGPKEKKEILLDGLQELEYRGYDSAGIAIIEGEKLNNFKAIGKLANLRNKTKPLANWLTLETRPKPMKVKVLVFP